MQVGQKVGEAEGFATIEIGRAEDGLELRVQLRTAVAQVHQLHRLLRRRDEDTSIARRRLASSKQPSLAGGATGDTRCGHVLNMSDIISSLCSSGHRWRTVAPATRHLQAHAAHGLAVAHDELHDVEEAAGLQPCASARFMSWVTGPHCAEQMQMRRMLGARTPTSVFIA